ncbi:MAG: beta-ketoacyl-[acyl-carrier-protein] synthase II [Phycisphaera sp.]|nr:MAG: beta-ketoacyl-[acyl-carrier-protein] synthase II [Phycisphaera sp.]
MSQKRRVVITGVGAVTNLGHDAPSTWTAMREGKSGISKITDPEFDRYEKWAVKISGALRDWNPTDHIEKREARRLDRCTQLGIVAAQQAIEHSGIDMSKEDPTMCGVVVGSGVGGISTIEQNVITLTKKGPGRINPFTVPRLMVNAVAGNISIKHNLQGPASAHATACASSGHAMGDAMRYIQTGMTDVMIAGGSEAACTPLCLGAFMTMKALSTRNDDPEGASRPFDADRDGFILAEGAAICVLESEEHAKARGADILGELVGFGNSCDASHITAPNAEGLGAARSMSWALRDAGLNTDQINYVNAHGTSTPLGDSAEIAAALSVFGDHARKSAGGKLVMSSTKSMHGHTLGASGAVETIACLGAVREGIIAPTINLEIPGTRQEDGSVVPYDMDLVPNVAREMPVNYAMNNTFGFGGHNVTLIVARYDG